MSSQDVHKTERSADGDEKPKLSTSAGSEWTFPSSPDVPNGSSYTLSSVSPLFPSGGLNPAHGHALPPRGNQNICPVPPLYPPLHPVGHPPHVPAPNYYPITSYHDAANAYPGSWNFYPAASHASIPISTPAPDPQLPLLPPPASDDESSTLPPVEEVLKKVADPAPKTAGAHRPKSKGKSKAVDESPAVTRGTKRKSTSDPAEEVEAKRPRATRGRAKNSPNYFKQDVDVLLDITREVLPVGARGWEEVAKHFNEMARKLKRPTRPAKSLELKVKNLAKTTKPTGSATVPEHVQQALEIDNLINEKVGMVILDDEDLQDVESDNYSDDDNPDDAPAEPPSSSDTKPQVKYIARHAKTPKPSSSQIRNSNHTFLTNIGLALDPTARQARQDGLHVQAMQNQQIASLTQQLRDAQKRNDSLCAQLIETERRYQEAERRADRAEIRSLITSTQNQSAPPPPIQNPVIPSNPTPRREPYRQDIIYPDGQSTIWVGGTSDDEDYDYIAGVNDSPGTHRYTYPDPRSYLPQASTSSSRASSSQQAPSSSHRAAQSPFSWVDTTSVPDAEDVNDAGTDCSQPL